MNVSMEIYIPYFRNIQLVIVSRERYIFLFYAQKVLFWRLKLLKSKYEEKNKEE
jgi:hypothetical protein